MLIAKQPVFKKSEKQVKVTAGLGLGARERLPITDPELEGLYGPQEVPGIPHIPSRAGQLVQPQSAPTGHILGYTPPRGYSPNGERLIQSTEAQGLFAEPMSSEDIANLSKRKKRVPHKFLQKAKVCVNCKWFSHYKRGKDGAHMNICNFHGGVPWDKAWTCSYSFCKEFADKEGEEVVKPEKEGDIE